MSDKVTEIFGIDVFNETVMAERLPKKTFAALKKTIENGEELDAQVAEVVANAMKDWAIEKGATHYSHWFQPLTGITAEKHDAFISPAQGGKVIMEFSGKELIKGEPDASSFPSGGLRATFEARGYTAWDCTSPAFVREDAAGVTLCIPTAFCSYTGEALDRKTPLLRSLEVLNTQVLRILRLFGMNEVKSISCSVGPEQEYFLVDRAKFLKRKDLIFTGRTLFGAMPPKGQEMDDHYFGTIKEKVASFMKELNVELWKLGITAKTQHNEAAPAQHELAPIYASANIATDHNQLIMECMKKVANRHGMECLLHEKPFAGVNGSGKHNNWSLVTDTGKNLLSPGKKPHENTQFLLFLSAILRAVDENAALLRAAASCPGNDHRLGGNEAPPAIISVFLGEQLEDILAQIKENGVATESIQGGMLNIGVHTLPELKKDATDRNRTSPFAFTGNKFEFRTVGSSMSIAGVNAILNTIVSDVLCDFADELERTVAGVDASQREEVFDKAVKELIAKTIREHERIIFSGNGYSKEWVAEAARRGLPNIPSMVEAIPAFTEERTIAMFEKHKVFSAAELHSRAEIQYEIYSKAINIEARTMLDMSAKQYIPAVIQYATELANSINSIRQACPEADVSVQVSILKELSSLLADAKAAREKLAALTSEAGTKSEGQERSLFFRKSVVPVMEELRAPIDKLEMLVAKNAWPVPSYGDLLFEQ